MSRRRRIVCLITGGVLVLFSILMGWTSSFLSARIGEPYSLDAADRLLDEMQGQGTVIVDESAARSLLYTAIYNEVQNRGAGLTFTNGVIGFNGAMAVVFGLWPSRANRPKAVLNTGV
jgi:hypothetical protein